MKISKKSDGDYFNAEYTKYELAVIVARHPEEFTMKAPEAGTIPAPGGPTSFGITCLTELFTVQKELYI
ncbi:hypothetical protein [Legionella sp.]|uniref:hypothetical protein n=1 Tax=Legionella sp. TaxID=459 RepID=UPI003D1177F6